MYLLNGESKQTLAFSDRGFQYGDGLFETIEVKNSTPLFLEQHLHRLQKDCRRLLIPAPDLTLLKKEAYQLAQGSDTAVLKLIITRGTGGRGYRQPDTIHPTRLLSLHPFPQYPADFFHSGITACFCHTRLGLNPALAGIKHLNRLEQVLARAEWNTPDIQEGIMLDFKDHIIEGTMSNIFLVKDQVLYTPLIEQSGVEGIIKNIIISLANKNDIQVIKNKINKEHMLSADELFLTNSIIGIWPIKQLETQSYKIGKLTKTLQSLFLDLKHKESHVC